MSWSSDGTKLLEAEYDHGELNGILRKWYPEGTPQLEAHYVAGHLQGLSISANGNSNGILWASTPYNGNAVHQSIQGVLYAFNADTLSLLWTDKTNDARDEIGMFAKYVPPVVANGKVYVPNFGPVGNNDGTGNLVVYGLLKPELTVTAANATMTAGAALPTLTGTVTGLVNGDTVGTTIIVTYNTTATSSFPTPVLYPITATVTVHPPTTTRWW